MSEFKGIVEAVDNPSMKEVKGLEDRLYGLEQLMYGARRLVQEQGEMAQVNTWKNTCLQGLSQDLFCLSFGQAVSLKPPF